MSDPSQMSPSEIDTILAELWEKTQKAEHYAEQMRVRIAHDEKSTFAPQLQDWRKRLAEHEAEIVALENEAFPYEAEYSKRGWRRFFLVTNQNGHIHTSMNCATCYPDTQYAWMPQYSGLTDEEIVQREAYRACTVCLPIAPAEQKAAAKRYTEEQRAARKAEKEAKQNEKLRKQAERAEKFLAKVEREVEKHFGSWDVLWSEYSIHGHDDKKSLYDVTLDMPTQVGDYLYDEMAARSSDRTMSRHAKDPKKIIAEAREKGLI